MNLVQLKVIGCKWDYRSPPVSSGWSLIHVLNRFQVINGSVRVGFKITSSRIYSVMMSVGFGRLVESACFLTTLGTNINLTSWDLGLKVLWNLAPIKQRIKVDRNFEKAKYTLARMKSKYEYEYPPLKHSLSKVKMIKFK